MPSDKLTELGIKKSKSGKKEKKLYDHILEIYYPIDYIYN